MKIRILSLNFKKNQKYRDKVGVWKTIKTGEIPFLEFGEMNHFGTSVLVGVDSRKIFDTGKVKRHISMLEAMDTQQRINWFEGNFPDVRPIMIAIDVINGLNGKRKPEAETSTTVTGSFNLDWGN